MDDLMDMELAMELKALRSEISKLKKLNDNYVEIIVTNDLGDEIGVDKTLSPEEEICVKGIEQILDLVKSNIADRNDIQSYDILHKNLRMIRGQVSDVKTRKKASKADLLRIVQKNEK